MISATRGQRVGHEEYIQMVTRMACELGADLLKTDYSGDSTSFAAVVDAAFRPILIAGGPKTNTPREALAMVRGAIDAGASGMFIGRNVFQSDDPVGMMRIMRRIIHEGLTVDAALDELDTMVNRK
jgi:DhnA family fructose-bisphosphate aldolase class Ia